MSSTTSGNPAPKGEEVLILVDWTPTWVVNPDDASVQEVWDRLVSLIEFDEPVPVLPVNASHLHRMDFQGIRRAYLCGIYGRLCVDTVAGYLTQIGIEVVFVTDGIVWAPPGPPGEWHEDGREPDSVRYAASTTTDRLAELWKQS